MLQGSCACGAVAFSVDGPAQGASVCHCVQCRKMSGHQWASAYASQAAVDIQGPLRWVNLSARAKRGICAQCGAFLFWKAHAEDTMSFALGALDGNTGLLLEKHIFTAERGDYYDIADGLIQK